MNVQLNQVKPAWLAGRATMSVLAGTRTRSLDGKLVLEVLGQPRGVLDLRQNLYLTEYGDQLILREAQIMSWNTADNSLKPFEDAVQVQNVFDRQRLNYDAEAEIMQSQEKKAEQQHHNIIGNQDLPDEVPEVQQTDVDQIDPSFQDFSINDQTDLSSVVDQGPIQQDYDFKVA